MMRTSLSRVFALLTALGLGCQNEPQAEPPPQAPGFAGMLDVEIRDTVEVRLVQASKDSDLLDVTLDFQSSTQQPFAAGKALRGAGRIEHIPEAATDLYVGKLTSAPVPEGPCGTRPMSLALALSRRENNTRVTGGLSIYCGDNVYSGVPARILRLSGKLLAR